MVWIQGLWGTEHVVVAVAGLKLEGVALQERPARQVSVPMLHAKAARKDAPIRGRGDPASRGIFTVVGANADACRPERTYPATRPGLGWRSGGIPSSSIEWVSLPLPRSLARAAS